MSGSGSPATTRKGSPIPNKQNVDVDILFQIPYDPSKILCFHEHPYKPWIVTAHDNGLVKLWDYKQKSLLQTINLSEKDEQKKEKSFVVQRIIEREYKGVIAPVSQAKSVDKPGQIHSVKFFDTDVQQQKYLFGQRLAAREGVPFAIKNPEFFACNWIIISCENRIVFINYITLQQKELKLSQLDGKIQNCCDSVGVGPFVAFGGVDGVVRVWDTSTWKLSHRLCTPGGHKSVHQIIGYLGPKGESILISAGSEGGLFWWKDMADAPAAKKSLGEIADLSFNASSGEIITSSNDKSVAWWNVLNGDYQVQVKSPTKTIYSRISNFAHPRFAFHYILGCTSSDSKVYMINKDGTVAEFFDVNDFGGPKKSVRIYDLQVHIQNPRVIFCNTRTNFYVISVEPNCQISTALTDAKERKGGSRKRGKKAVFIDSGSRLVVSGLKRKGKATTQKMNISSQYVRLSVSSTGRFLGVFWPNEQRYQIWDLHTLNKATNTWNIVQEGKATDLAWFGPKDHDTFGVIGLKTQETEATVKQKRLVISTTNKKITVEKQIQTIELYRIDEKLQVHPMESGLHTNCSVNRLHSGLILGFHLDSELKNPLLQMEKDTKSGSSIRGKLSTKIKTKEERGELPSDACMRWVYRDATGQSVEVDFPDPTWLLWDPMETYCLFVYPNQFSIAEIRPTFKMVYHSRRQITSAAWYKRALIYCTETTVECMFLNNIPIMVATTNISEAIALAELYHSESFERHMMPPGAVSMVAVDDDTVFVIDSQAVISAFPISSPRFKFYFLVSSGQADDALNLVSSFKQEDYLELAQFLCTYGFPVHATKIKQLAIAHKLDICYRYNLFEIGTSLAIELISAVHAHLVPVNQALEHFKKLVNLIEDNEVKEQILLLATELDENIYKDIVIHIVVNSGPDRLASKKKLKNLFEDLSERGKTSLAVFCAQFISESKVIANALRANNFADFVTFSSKGAIDPQLLSDLDEQLQTEQLQHVYNMRKF